MSKLEILKWPDPRLAQPCAPAEISAETRVLAGDMLETMYGAPGRGLAAPQVGQTLRLFVMDTTWKDAAPSPMIFFNPEITASNGTPVESAEGCLSIPGLSVPVARAPEITLAWQDSTGAPQTASFTGFAASCIQHEMDHLDGIVTLDRVDPAARAALVAAYEAAG